MPYVEQSCELNKSNLDDEWIYVEAEILLNNRLVRLMDISVERWLDLKYGNHELAPNDEVRIIVTNWLSRSFKKQFQEFMEIEKNDKRN